MSEDRARIFVESHLVDGLSKPAAFAKSQGRKLIPSDNANAFREWKRPEVQAIASTYQRSDSLRKQEESGVIEANATVETDRPKRRLRRWTRDEMLDRLQEIAGDIRIDPRVCVAAVALYAKYTGLDMPEKSVSHSTLELELRNLGHVLA
jgi:hypothetical protein